MKLFKMLMNRRRKFKTWLDLGKGAKYYHDEYTISVFDTVSEYIMFHVLNMNYCYSYCSNLGFSKVYDLDYLMEIAPIPMEDNNE